MNTPWHAMLVCVMFCIGAGTTSFARAALHADLSACTAIGYDAQRLHCYDRLAARVAATPAPAEEAQARGRVAAVESAPASPLAERWELDASARKGTFSFTPYQQSYLLPYHYTDRTNNSPSKVGEVPVVRDDVLNNIEATFQLSFKVKLAQDLFPAGSDLWFGYTQYSVWQVYNEALLVALPQYRLPARADVRDPYRGRSAAGCSGSSSARSSSPPAPGAPTA